MKTLGTIVLTALVSLAAVSIAVAHPWTMSDIDVTDPSPSTYKIRGIIKSTKSYDFAGFMIHVKEKDAYGDTVAKKSSKCEVVCAMVEFSKAITLPQDDYYVVSQHCGYDGNHQLHPNSGFAQTTGDCAGHAIDLNTLDLQG